MLDRSCSIRPLFAIISAVYCAPLFEWTVVPEFHLLSVRAKLEPLGGILEKLMIVI